MTVTLVTNAEGLVTYRDTYKSFEAAGKYAGKSTDFVFEITVDIDEITFAKGLATNHVLVSKRYQIEKIG